MTGSHETFSERSEISIWGNPSADAANLSKVERRARSLIREISDACAELRNIAYSAVNHDQKDKLTETLEQKISARRSELESIKDMLMLFIHSAEANAQKLEGQNLNDPVSKMSLQRAAEGARSEVKRMAILLEEIEQALSMSALAGDDIARIRNSGDDDGDSRFIAKSRETRMRNDPPERDHSRGQVETGILQPLLGRATSGGLSESLKKVPLASQESSKIQAGLYKGGVYIENAHFNNLEMNLSSQGVPASSAKDGKGVEQSLSQKGGDGSYIAGGDIGILSPTQKKDKDIGVW